MRIPGSSPAAASSEGPNGKAATIFPSASITGSKTSGVVQLIKDLSNPVNGKDILIVEDILDSGLTLSYITETLRTKDAASVKVCTLLNKPDRRSPSVNVQADYEGFVIPDEFVVGYGLDYNEKYRNLPFIGVLDRKVYQ